MNTTELPSSPLERTVMQRATGGAAFPVLPPQDTAAGVATGYPFPEAGMTLRDYFAAMAMQAAATNSVGAASLTFAERANWAYIQADAMLVERNKQ